MTDALQDGARQYQILTWIESLNEGYGADGKSDNYYEPTVSNIAGFLWKNEQYAPQLKEKYGNIDGFYPETKDAVRHIKGLVGERCRIYHGRGHLSKDTVPQKVTRDLLVEEGIDKLRTSRDTAVYSLNQKGHSWRDYYEEVIQQKKKAAPPNVDRDTIVVPEERLYNWGTTEVSIPRVEIPASN